MLLRPVSPRARTVLMEPPEGRAVWPPQDTWKSLDVSKGGWDWASAAVTHGIFDPLDLIHFNFLTTSPKEVNWYLRHYVGCINSDDGKNFTFSGSAPGAIFIPQYGYTRKTPGLTAVEQSALRAYRTKILKHYPDFWHRGVHFTPRDLERLIQKIEDNKIDIIWDTTIKSSGAWRFKESAIYLSMTDFDYHWDLETLVHEATHALVDILTARYDAVKDYKNKDDEFCCFFAEACWFAGYFSLEDVELEIYFADEIDIWSASLYLAYIAKTKGYHPLVTKLFDDLYENTIEKYSQSYVDTNKKPIFPDPFNPYRTLGKAIARDPSYKRTANRKRRPHRKPVGK